MSRGFITLPVTGWLALAAGAIILVLVVTLKIQSGRLAAEKESHATTKAQYAAFVSETKRLGDEAKRKADAERERQRQVNIQSTRQYEKRIAGIAAAYQRLLGESAGSSGRDLPAVPDTARTTDGAARDQQLSSLLRHADEQTARLESLQRWVRDQINP